MRRSIGDGTANGGKAADWTCDRHSDHHQHRHLWRHQPRHRRQRNLAHHIPTTRNSFLSGSTQVNSTTIRPMLNNVMTTRSRGRDYADLLMMSPEHYAAYDAATIAIQRQTNETSLGKLGFCALEYIGGGKRAEIVLDGGIGSQHAG